MQNKLETLDFIIVGQQPWDMDGGSNCKDIAVELSRHNRVLYVNSPLDRNTLLKGRKDPKVMKRLNITKGQGESLVLVHTNLWTYYPDCIVESINWINAPFLFDSLNRINNKRFSKSILKAAELLKFDNVILFNDNEMFKGFYLKEFIKPTLSIYYSRDNMIAVDYWKKHGVRLEPRLIGKSDLCFSNSDYLANYCKLYNAKSFNVGQGCDLEGFKHAFREDLQGLPNDGRPIIGYVGALISSRLNIDIIRNIALKLPSANIVLIGGQDESFLSSDLHKLDNVIFLGNKEAELVPSYIHKFDVCINPQVVNSVTIGNYPRKIDEYLAIGKPTVASKTNAMEDFKDLVYLADDEDHFVSLVEEALCENNTELVERRIIVASSHSWENSVGAMFTHIRKLVSSEI